MATVDPFKQLEEDILEGRLYPQYPNGPDTWKNGCGNFYPKPKCHLNPFTERLYDEIWHTSPNLYEKCPLRDLKYRILPYVESRCRVFFLDELPLLQWRVVQAEGLPFTSQDRRLMRQVLDDWYNWMELWEFDPDYISPDEDSEFDSEDTGFYESEDILSSEPSPRSEPLEHKSLAVIQPLKHQPVQPIFNSYVSIPASNFTETEEKALEDDGWEVVKTVGKKRGKRN